MKLNRILSLLLIAVMLTMSVSVAFAQDAEEEPNPFAPADLVEIADILREATAGNDPTAQRIAVVVNVLSPFWTAAAIGEQRAASELGTAVVFMAPAQAGDIASQQSLLETLVTDGYNGIAFSAIDPAAVVSIVENGMEQGVNFITMDSDSADSGRPLFLALDNYTGGFLAGQAMVDALGDDCGQVVGFVGFITAQNAVDRIAGIEASFEGTDCVLETVLVDNGDPSIALSNSEAALTTYPDLKGMIGIYSYNGPAAIQALRTNNRVGEVKLVAFDLATETMQGLRDGVVSAAIGQRVYYYGYLPVYILYAMSTIGVDETMALLEPYLSGENGDLLDAGADIVTPENIDAYLEYLDSIGIVSQ
ncbi:MAG: substrate-binding domain-containing protein [Burkholderiales bacterium]|nr:substrate-binding domain-containing protein [Anaerolineae bacterium]